MKGSAQYPDLLLWTFLHPNTNCLENQGRSDMKTDIFRASKASKWYRASKPTGKTFQFDQNGYVTQYLMVRVASGTNETKGTRHNSTAPMGRRKNFDTFHALPCLLSSVLSSTSYVLQCTHFCAFWKPCYGTCFGNRPIIVSRAIRSTLAIPLS